MAARGANGRFVGSGSTVARSGGASGGSYVAIKDMGFKRAVDRLSAAARCWAKVGVMKGAEVKRYAAGLEAAYAWKSRADQRLERIIDKWLEVVNAEIIAGNKSFTAIFTDFANKVADEYRAEIHVTPSGVNPGLIDTGAFLASIGVKIQAPTI